MLILLRQAYHDMSTHNIEDGTGGMDASIRYELDREEVRQSGSVSREMNYLTCFSRILGRE